MLWKDFIDLCNENKSLRGISYSQIQQSIVGTELRFTWGLNPLANDFEPSSKGEISSVERVEVISPSDLPQDESNAVTLSSVPTDNENEVILTADSELSQVNSSLPVPSPLSSPNKGSIRERGRMSKAEGEGKEFYNITYS
jgi:hypothetical protein